MTLAPEEIHILGLSAPVLLRMLKAREDRVLSRIYGEFRNGKTDHLIALAEFASIRETINDINAALRTHEKQQEKLHATSTRNNADTSAT